MAHTHARTKHTTGEARAILPAPDHRGPIHVRSQDSSLVLAFLVYAVIALIVNAIVHTAIRLLDPWAKSSLDLPAEEYLLLPLVGHRALFAAHSYESPDPPSLADSMFLRPLHGDDVEMLRKFGQTETGKGQRQIREHFRSLDSYNTMRIALRTPILSLQRSTSKMLNALGVGQPLPPNEAAVHGDAREAKTDVEVIGFKGLVASEKGKLELAARRTKATTSPTRYDHKYAQLQEFES